MIRRQCIIGVGLIGGSPRFSDCDELSTDLNGAEQTTLIGSRAMVNVDMIGHLRNDQLEVFGVRSAPGLRRLVSMQNIDDGLKLKFSWEMSWSTAGFPAAAASAPSPPKR